MDELEIFMAVVEERGFSAAAARLDSTTASVSRRIKALEQRLGTRLLQRTTRSLQLTEAGELYYQAVRRAVGDLRAAEDQLQEVTTQAFGELRIAAPMSFGQRRLSSLVARFPAAHPRLRVSLLLDDKETDLLEAGVDLALRIAYPTDSSFIAKPIVPVPRYLCASPDYLEMKGTPTKPADLLQHDCLHYNVISELEEWTFDGSAGSETVAVKGGFCSNNGDVLLQAAIEGLGITLLPDFIVADALAEGRLVRILKKRERAPLTLFALYPSRQFVPVKTRLFIDYIIGTIH